MSMFTQWVPHTFADEPDEAAIAAYADRVIARVEAVAPGFTSSVLHRQVIGPHQMQDEYGLVGGNIFHAGRRRATPTCVPRSRACTRPARPPTAAAGSRAFRAVT
jgi:phytoene dehydrogenase-like protein